MTTPDPLNEKLRKLVAKWRDIAKTWADSACDCSTCYGRKAQAAECARDLEAALAAHSVAPPPRVSTAPPSINANQTNAEQFHKDVEFIHACHIEGALRGACREVFERREREAFERGTALSQDKPTRAGEPK